MRIQLKRLESKIDKAKTKQYTKIGDPVCHPGKEVVQMADRKTVTAQLYDDRGVWTVRGRVWDPKSGKTKQKAKSTGLKVKDKTKRRAEQAMREIVEAWEAEANAAPSEKPKETSLFSAYINGWLKNKSLSVRPNTAKSYRDYAKVHILPALGDYPVNAITWRILQDFCDRMLADHSKSTVKKFFIVIRGALDDAVRDEAIQASPEHLVKWPRSERVQKARALSGDEVSKLLEAAEDAGEPIRAAVTLALFYGLRRSEVCGLRWIDIDFTKGTLHVQHTVTQNGSLILDDDHTKTRGSNRTLALIDQTVPYLKRLRAEQLRSGLLMDKVMAWPDGRPVRPDGIKSMFRTILKKAGIEKARFHDLRHTAATMLANAGVPPKQLQAFLGHNDIEMTLGVYVHTPENTAAAISAKMGEVMQSVCFSEKCSGKCSGLQFESASEK